MGDESYNKGYSAIPLQNYKHATFTLQTTYDPIFVIFGCIKTSTFSPKTMNLCHLPAYMFHNFFQHIQNTGKCILLKG